MVGHQIQYRHAPALHVLADEVQHFPGDAPAAAVFLHVHRADVGRQVLAVVEVVLDDAQTADDPAILHHGIPLGDGALPFQAGVHAVEVRLLGNAPFFVEPLRHGFLIFRPVGQTDDRMLFHSSSVKYYFMLL